ncbi:MAG: universal stress protein [Deltaproteobacteria bacterium]|nr:universal stress protein [Deltaproteobacteria bacterium]
MKNRFIVLIDFSESSHGLLRFAHNWSKSAEADLVLVHHTSVLLPAMTPTESRRKLTMDANRDAVNKLKVFAETVVPEGTSVKFIASEKPLVALLGQLLQTHYNHLVFLGIKKTGLLKRMLVGSEAVKIIDGVDNLIVAMPQDAICCTPESVHVAVQKNIPLNVFEFNKFLKFTGEDIHTIAFFSLIAPGDDREATEKYLKELTALYSDKRDTSYELYRGDAESAGLKNLISQKKDDFIVVQRGSRLFVDQMFRKFLISELVYEGRTPLIILP